MIATIRTNSYHYRKEKIKKITNKINYNKLFYMDLVDDYDYIKNLVTFNMMFDNNVYVIDANNYNKLSKKLTEQLCHSKVNAKIIIFCESSNLFYEYYTSLAEYNYTQLFLSKKQDLQLLISNANDLNLKIDYYLLTLIYELSNNNLDLSIAEIRKLHIYFGENHKITLDEVNTFINDFRTSKFFEYTNIIFTNNDEKKLNLINHFILTDQSISFINFMNNYIFIAFEVKLLANLGFSSSDISNKLKKNQFYIQNIYQSVSKIKIQKLFDLNDKLINIALELSKNKSSIKKTLYILL